MQLTIQKKLFFIILLLLAVPSLIIGIVGFNSAKSSLNQLSGTMLENSTKQVVHMISALNNEVDKGTLSLEEAQETVKTFILGERMADGTRPVNTNIDLGEYGYIFVIDNQGNVQTHPSLEGDNAWEFQASDGSYFVQEFINVAESGGGFVYYDFPHPSNPDRNETKIGYSEIDPYWGWVIVPSSYMSDYNSGANQVLYILLITLGLSLLIGTVITYLFSRHLSKPIQALSQQVQEVASGNLRVSELNIKNKDEIGLLATSVNKMTKNLKEIIGQVSSSSEQVASTSEELSASSGQTSKATEEITEAIQEISSGVEKQMESIEEMSNVVTQISTGIEAISKNAEEVNQSSEETANTAQKGKQVVFQSMEQMNQINASSIEMEKVIQALGQKSEQIENVISIITSISDQTNLLALNAAIEAARAGEHGKGFAVVADEVRKLAEESSRAGSQVNELIKDIQQEVSKTVDAMGENGRAIEEGITLANQAGKAFEEITDGVENVSYQFQDISAAIQQINTSSESLLRMVDGTEHISKEAAGYAQNVAASAEEQNASMEEITSVADTLATMGEELQNSVKRFSL
ncbi:methyl-accepting chemotaxis protein [Alkalihalobacterium alkalinitrilicum]|uniref:methyl-accepting chemotaxis protein n=1 Tax=Alkalihalobacterium alkalinitrilicum TaxID=427920 RepID=UPI000995080D|nr:methyl-accepting chemotaxis protein [Alkalihalobacterium alkalinitrilicum]